MKKPSIKSIKRTGANFAPLGHVGSAKFAPVDKIQTRFGRLPLDVMRRGDLGASEKVVFAAMALEFRNGQLIYVSRTALAGICGMSRRQVSYSVAKLRSFGLIQTAGRRAKQVQPYRLVHPLFEPNPEVAEREPKVVTARRLLKCGKCHREVYGLAKTGWCRTCMNDLKLTRKVRRVVGEELDERGVPRKVVA